MGKRGPQPKPAELKATAGQGVPPGRPAIPAGDEPPATPRGVLINNAAKKMWRELVEPLHSAGVLKVTDIPALVMLCNHYAMALAAASDIESGGMWAIDERGLARKNPLTTVLAQQSKLFLQYAGHFGLTPSTRGQLVVGQDGGDSLAAMLFKAINGDD